MKYAIGAIIIIGALLLVVGIPAITLAPAQALDVVVVRHPASEPPPKARPPVPGFDHPVVKGPTRPCSLPQLASDEQLVLLSVSDGAGISSVTIAGSDTRTGATRVNVEAGSAPVYLILASTRPIVWWLDGATDRLGKVVLMSPSSLGSGVATSAAVGVNASRVTFVRPGTCFGALIDSSGSTVDAAFDTLVGAVGRKPDTLVYARNLGGIGMPSGKALPPQPENVALPAGFDGETWKRALTFAPAGLFEIDPGKVVAAAPAVRYDVLPEWIGLAQLVGQKALVASNGSFTVAKPIPHYPIGLINERAARFVVAAGVATPKGNTGSSCVMDASGRAISAVEPCNGGVTVILTSAQVQSFIKSYPAVSAEAETVGKRYSISSRSKADYWGAWTEQSKAWPAMNSVAKTAGYADFKSWLDVVVSVNEAYQLAKFLPTLKAMGRDVDNNAGVGPGLKANLAVVMPYVGQLDGFLVYQGF